MRTALVLPLPANTMNTRKVVLVGVVLSGFFILNLVCLWCLCVLICSYLKEVMYNSASYIAILLLMVMNLKPMLNSLGVAVCAVLETKLTAPPPPSHSRVHPHPPRPPWRWRWGGGGWLFLSDRTSSSLTSTPTSSSQVIQSLNTRVSWPTSVATKSPA